MLIVTNIQTRIPKFQRKHMQKKMYSLRETLLNFYAQYTLRALKSDLVNTLRGDRTMLCANLSISKELNLQRVPSASTSRESQYYFE